ncbi:MAG: type II toxin-antitoxin system RelE/ParE family toxin [Bacteroidales bacterium]|jgi:mRNA interferase RelE/StbE|nr:type II toxin-antitoxin system RelE/ParE family toxin [Bacteroidales bacterium]MDD3915352.1 type II toxin-antitoxin system RelE/ParE family toxin [Bacteroidales bacterium]
MILEFDKYFSKSIDKIGSQVIKNKLVKMIDVFENASSIEDIPNIKKIVGFQNCYRYRIGDYRVGFELNGNTVLFIVIAHRKDIYRLFP